MFHAVNFLSVFPGLTEPGIGFKEGTLTPTIIFVDLPTATTVGSLGVFVGVPLDLYWAAEALEG